MFLSIIYFAVACTAQQTKPTDWVVQCKPVEDIIDTTIKAKKFNAGAVEQVFAKLQENPTCSDGFYAEGMTDIVVKALASDFAITVTHAHKNEKLYRFLVKHINASADWLDLDKVTANSDKLCPLKQAARCKEIKEISAKASREAKSVKK